MQFDSVSESTASVSAMEDDGDDKDDTKRRTRNLSEKKRRDQFNVLVNELSSMISTNNRKMDKSTVLKSTILYLKNHNEVTVRSRAHDVQEDWKPAFLSNEEFTYLVLEALEGFVMVFSASGRIYYVSESISLLLGHNPAEVVNKTIFDLASEVDRPNLYTLLQNPESTPDSLEPFTKDNEVRFQCYLRRGTLDFREEPTYELIQFSGHYRVNIEQVDKDDMSSSYHHNYDSRILFICTGRLYTPQLIRDVSLVDTSKSEFTSRHSLEWKFLFLDHRAPPIIGYLPFEVLGTSGYDYYHFDDLEKVVTCHEALMRKGELTSCYYRFLTKGQQWIWLQSRFYITYHQWNSKPEFVVCTHRVVSLDAQAAPERDCSGRLDGEYSFSDIDRVAKQEGPEASEAAVSEVDPSQTVIKEQPVEESIAPLSPSYMSDASDAFGNSYQHVSRPGSVKSASASSTTGTVVTSATAGTVWPHASYVRYTTGSDTASLSGDSRSSQRDNSRDMNPPVSLYGAAGQGIPEAVYTQPSKSVATLAPQHRIGTQYLEPAPYVGVSSVLPLTLPTLPPLPVIVSPDQAQLQLSFAKFDAREWLWQEQLQRKHEQLQQMIVQQQEELRQVKEQLLLARLGMLQPLINVPNTYMNPEDIQQTQLLPGQVVYEGSSPRSLSGYPSAHTPLVPHPPHPPHATPHHPHMPQ